MNPPVSDLDTLIRSMQPTLHEGIYCYAAASGQQPAPPPADWIASVREDEGLSLIVCKETAERYGMVTLFDAAWITLTVHSDLAAVGLTAAFAAVLGRAGISCNVVAGSRHDHIFVPYEKAQAAMDALRHLQQNGLNP